MTLDISAPAQTPWVDDEAIRRDGAAMVCPDTMVICVRYMDGFAAHYRAAEPQDVVIARGYFGKLGEPTRFNIAIIPPRQ